jgi:hypothetical protein
MAVDLSVALTEDRNGSKGHTGVLADLADLENLIAVICQLGLFVVDLVPHVRPRDKRKSSLPEKFALPERLVDV